MSGVSTVRWLVCLLIGHADEEFLDQEAPHPEATFRYCHRCGRETPRSHQ